jgi:hypothetical protein
VDLIFDRHYHPQTGLAPINKKAVRVLLDRDNDTLAFEFITDEGAPKALPPPKKPKTEESV